MLAGLAACHRSAAFTNSIGMEFVYIQPGTFQMGSSNGEYDEKPVHTVRISRGFLMQAREATQGEWRAVMGSNPSYLSGCGADCPVENVSWNDVQNFIRKLNAKGEGEYRLPTEAEWEYACRAGTTGDYGGPSLDEMGWYTLNSGQTKYEWLTTHPVGEKKPNAWGLYDMHGNVWEWCQDKYEQFYYAASPASDPAGPVTDRPEHVARGGAWYTDGARCRSAARYNGHSIPIGNGYSSISPCGFRLVRSAARQLP